MTAAVPPGEAVEPPEMLVSVWQEFIDARFPSGVWAEETDENRNPWLFPFLIVMGLQGEFPILFGFDYFSGLDFTMTVLSWDEVGLGSEDYRAKVALPDRPVELRSQVPPVLRSERAQRLRAAQRIQLENTVRDRGRARLRTLIGADPASATDSVPGEDAGPPPDPSAEEVQAAVARDPDGAVAASRVCEPGFVLLSASYAVDVDTGRAVPPPLARDRLAHGRDGSMK